MTSISMLGIVLRASFLLALSLAVLPLVRGASASLRRWLILLGLSASLALPLLAWAFPGRPVVYVPSPTLVGHVVAEALSPSVASSPRLAAQPASTPSAPSRSTLSSWLISI